VAYVPAIDRAIQAVTANPEKSDRAIAKDIGASPTTVGKARELSTTGQLETRTGLDGKARKLPKSGKKWPPSDARWISKKRKKVDDQVGIGHAFIAASTKTAVPSVEMGALAVTPNSSAEDIDFFLQALGNTDIGRSLEGLGDRFFAALQHAPNLKARIERRVIGQYTAPGVDKRLTNLLRMGLGPGAGAADQMAAIGKLNAALRERRIHRDDVNITLRKPRVPESDAPIEQPAPLAGSKLIPANRSKARS
jgi:hypothetical protein